MILPRGVDLDEKRTEQTRRAAQSDIASGATGLDYAKAQAELAQAAAQLQAIRRLRKKAR